MPEKEQMFIPAFQSEAEEATWWDSNQDPIAERFLEAAAKGTLGHGRVARQAAAVPPKEDSPGFTPQVSESDIRRARTLASSKGLQYEAYLQMLIHEGLQREEKRAG
jgi:predicted DNA binding CopG/RHH family protein